MTNLKIGQVLSRYIFITIARARQKWRIYISRICFDKLQRYVFKGYSRCRRAVATCSCTSWCTTYGLAPRDYHSARGDVKASSDLFRDSSAASWLRGGCGWRLIIKSCVQLCILIYALRGAPLINSDLLITTLYGRT